MRYVLSLIVVASVAAGQQPSPMPGPSAELREKMKQFGRGQGKLNTGDIADDFTLKVQRSNEQISLSHFRGVKPVALIFGSYT